MKKLIFALFLVFTAFAAAQTNPNLVFVNGYYKSNGTFVAPHYRTAPNNTLTDNLNYRGNYNPYSSGTATVYRDNWERFINTPAPEFHLPVPSPTDNSNTEILLEKIRRQTNVKMPIVNTGLYNNPAPTIKPERSQKGGKYFKVENGVRNYTVQVL